jgi:hypothetical protein
MPGTFSRRRDNASTAHMLMVVNDERTVAADFTPYRTGRPVTRYSLPDQIRRHRNGCDSGQQRRDFNFGLGRNRRIPVSRYPEQSDSPVYGPSRCHEHPPGPGQRCTTVISIGKHSSHRGKVSNAPKAANSNWIAYLAQSITASAV